MFVGRGRNEKLDMESFMDIRGYVRMRYNRNEGGYFPLISRMNAVSFASKGVPSARKIS